MNRTLSRAIPSPSRLSQIQSSKKSIGFITIFGRNLTNYPKQAIVARFKKFGFPKTVLKLEQEDIAPLGENGVLIKMIHSPIHPMDIDIISGKFNKLPALPAIGGTEGVGQVLAVGPKTKKIKVGDLVVPATLNFGTWRNYASCAESSVMAIPNERSIPTEYLATLSIAPLTALRLLDDFVDLREGDVIIQNGANGMVGLSVIQLAAARGVKTINIIRRRSDYPQLVEFMKQYGAYIVCSEDYARTAEFRQLIADLPKPKLGLNSVGGDSATEIARLLGPGGTLVTYGGSSHKPLTIPTRSLLFSQITLKGFFLDRWIQTNGPEAREKVLNQLVAMAAEKKLRLWIERHPFEDFAEALERAIDSETRARKVLLNF